MFELFGIRYVAYFMSLTFTLVKSQNLCPAALECYCFLSGYDVRADCIGPEIEFISEELPWNMTQLYVSSSSMSTLTAGNLSMYKDLRQVDLIENQLLTTIETGAFEGLDGMENLVILHTAVSSIKPDTLPVMLTALYLQYNQLTSIPPLDGLTDLELINLEENHIGEILGNAFSTNTKLLDIYLSYNSIESIATDAFKNLNNVANLYMDNNQITSLEPGDFNGLSKLHILSLMDNNLKELTDGSFSGIGPNSLIELYLSSNQIASIGNSVFSSFSNLSSLYLTNNRLTSVPSTALKGPPMLQFLDLSSNLFETIDDDAFSGMSNLMTLNVGGMETLTGISHNAFVGMSKLAQLTLQGNRKLTSLTPDHLPDDELQQLKELKIYNNGFTSLQEEVFSAKPSLERVELFGSPFHCDCSLQWMPRVIEEDVIWAREWVSGNPILCQTPRHLEAFDIPLMKENDFTCEMPKVEPSYDSDQEKVVAFLHGNATLKAVATAGIPRSWWVSPSGGEYVPLRKVPTHIQRVEDISALETYQKTPDETVVLASLEFTNATLADAGVYTVWASNHRGNVTAQVILEVLLYELTPAPLETTPTVGGADAMKHLNLWLLVTVVIGICCKRY